MGKKIEVKEGDRYGRLTIIKEVEPLIRNNGKTRRRFESLCDCGNLIICLFDNMRRKHTNSCGCYNLDIMTERFKVFSRDYSTTHGLSYHSLYKTWSNMIQRCYNPNHTHYKHYGGRGITICDRWRYSFPNFLEDMGEKPGPEYSIDRINPYGNYEPSNCRWATIEQQANNKRKKG